MNRQASIRLIEKAAREKWIKSLALYHFLKIHFVNSCVYGYRSRMKEISGMTGICEKTIYKYIQILRSKDLVYEHSHNLCLRSIKGYKGWKKTTLMIPDGWSYFDLIYLLFGKLIEQSARHQAFAESVRRSRRGDDWNSRFCESPFSPSLSIRSLAKLCNISVKTISLVIKNLERLEVLRIEKPKPVLVSNDFTELECIEDYPGYRFNVGKNLFRIFGQRIDFLQFPVYLKKYNKGQIKQYERSICY